MNRNLVIAIVIIAVLGGVAAYLFWPQPQPAVTQVAPPPPPPPQPIVEEAPRLVEAPPAKAPLPQLSESDQFVIDELSTMLRLKSLTNFLRPDRVIRNIVATVDNLPTKRAPMKVMPIERAAGTFIVDDTGNGLVISARNAERYTRYMNFADAVDAAELVGLYVRLYPLFQQAYEELGYPKRYFNDRLLVAIDDMLNAPDVAEPVGVLQPNVFYIYATPDLEDRSIGQRILMRTGSRIELKLKTKLRAIRQEIQRHMQNKRIEKS